MKYEVGDTVLLLHSKEEGKIVDIMNEDMVMVNVDGIEFPVFTDQIDFPYFERFSKQASPKKKKATKMYIDQVPKEKKKQVPKLSFEGVRLEFFPVYNVAAQEESIQYFKLFLVNRNPEAYFFEYRVQYKALPGFDIENTLMSMNDFYLHNISQEELNDISRFIFYFSLKEPDRNKTERLEKNIRVKAKTLFSKIEGMLRKNVPSFGFDLFKDYPAKEPESYLPLPEPKHGIPLRKIKGEQPRSVVDLHIEKIMSDHQGMDNFEIMLIQLNYFEKYYRLAVAGMQPDLIVIHGVGTGKLRDEIHARLKNRKEVKYFVNQYHPLYGFGATEIYFQY